MYGNTERDHDICSVIYEKNIDGVILSLSSLCCRRKAFIVTDDTVASLYLDKFKNSALDRFDICGTVILEHGEGSKDLNSLQFICSSMIESELSRKDIVINLGGGMVSDIGGFAASIYMRGIDYINIPTTLLGMVDSSIGGKTAVDFSGIKNVLGAFHFPIATIICPDFLNTLKADDIKSGMGEIIKYYAVSGKFDISNSVPDDFSQLIMQCCNIKKEFVLNDRYDNGMRKILNFGHTFGHAFESASNFSVSHGEAVGLGMLAVCRFGEALGITDADCFNEIKQKLDLFGMKTDYSHLTDGAVSELVHDKKYSSGNIDMIFIRHIGEPVIKSCSLETVKAFLSNERA